MTQHEEHPRLERPVLQVRFRVSYRAYVTVVDPSRSDRCRSSVELSHSCWLRGSGSPALLAVPWKPVTEASSAATSSSTRENSWPIHSMLPSRRRSICISRNARRVGSESK